MLVYSFHSFADGKLIRSSCQSLFYSETSASFLVSLSYFCRLAIYNGHLNQIACSSRVCAISLYLLNSNALLIHKENLGTQRFSEENDRPHLQENLHSSSMQNAFTSLYCLPNHLILLPFSQELVFRVLNLFIFAVLVLFSVKNFGHPTEVSFFNQIFGTNKLIFQYIAVAVWIISEMEPVTVNGRPGPVRSGTGREFLTGRYNGTGQNFPVFAYFIRKKRYKTIFLEIRHLSLLSEIISISEHSTGYSIPSKIIAEDASYFIHHVRPLFSRKSHVYLVLYSALHYFYFLLYKQEISNND